MAGRERWGDPSHVDPGHDGRDLRVSGTFASKSRGRTQDQGQGKAEV